MYRRRQWKAAESSEDYIYGSYNFSLLIRQGQRCRPSLPHVIVIAVTNDRSTHQCGHESCLWNDLLITFLQDGAALALALALPAVRLVRLIRGYHAIGYMFYYPAAAAKTIAGFPF
eukprot:scaffold8470_cov134-Skeletonema_dohrnii-CCMP3373.AAC.1